MHADQKEEWISPIDSRLSAFIRGKTLLSHLLGVLGVLAFTSLYRRITAAS
jgi:hypothetical protein